MTFVTTRSFFPIHPLCERLTFLRWVLSFYFLHPPLIASCSVRLPQFITSTKSWVRSHADRCLCCCLYFSWSHFFVSMACVLPNLLIPGHSFVKKLDRVWWASLTHMQRRISILVAHALTLEEYSFRFCRCLSRHSRRYFMAPLIVFSLANVAFGLVCYRCFRWFLQCNLLAWYWFQQSF